MTDIIPIFVSAYSYGQSTLTFEEAGSTKPGNPASIVDLAREAHLKQVVVIDERMDGFPEALKNLSKPFKATPPKILPEYAKEARGEKAETPETIAKGQKLFDAATAKYAREKGWSTDQIQLIFGLKLTVVPDLTVKTPESEVNESSVVIFMRDAQPALGVRSPSYTDLVKIHNHAWTIGKYEGYGRIDWKTLKTMWTPNLVLALPFFSSFVARNLLTMAQIVPDLPTTPWLMKEVDSHIPFAHLIERALDQYATASGALIQPVKTVYYRDSDSFTDYTNFRARNTRSRGKSGTFSAPGVDNLSSDQFSMEAWKKLT